MPAALRSAPNWPARRASRTNAPYKAYRSSDWAERLFCATCGTSVLWRSTDVHFHVVPVALLATRQELSLAAKIFIDEKQGYDAPNLLDSAYVLHISWVWRMST